MLDDLFTYRLGGEGFLTVTNASNHARDLAWMQSHGEEFDADVHDRQADFAMLAVQGPQGPSARAGAWPTDRCRRACTAASAPSPVSRCWYAVPATQARTASS